MGHKLVVGPWVGEIGWEAMKWQGYVRKHILDNLGNLEAPMYDEILIGGRPGHKCLYEDPRYPITWVDCNIPSGDTCCDLCGGTLYNELMDKFMEPGDVRYPARRIMDEWDATAVAFPKGTAVEPFHSQAFIRIPKSAKQVDVVLHARCWGKYDSARKNSTYEEWAGLVKALSPLTVGCVGLTGQAWHIDGTADFMNLPLDETVKAMSGADYVIGTDSGPMHVAAMTHATRIVVAMTHEHDRYLKYWKPFSDGTIKVVTSVKEISL